MLVSCDLLDNDAENPDESRTAANTSILADPFQVSRDDKYTRDELCHEFPRWINGTLGNANAKIMNCLNYKSSMNIFHLIFHSLSEPVAF